MKRITIVCWSVFLAAISTIGLAQSWFTEGNAPYPGDTPERSAQKINYTLYAISPTSLDYFPEGTTPAVGDSLSRSLQKINALLKYGTFGGGGSSSNGFWTNSSVDVGAIAPYPESSNYPAYFPSSVHIVGAVTNNALQASSLVVSSSTKVLGSITGGTSGYVLTANGAGVLPSYNAMTTGSAIQKANGSGALTPATLGTDYDIPANPTGTIGLTAVNGSAATQMRSDGAPALPSTGGAYHGAVLTPWIGTNNSLTLQWRKAPQVWEFVSGGIGDLVTIALNSATAVFPSGGLDTIENGIAQLSTGALTNGVAGIKWAPNDLVFTTNSFAVMMRVKIPTTLSTDTDAYEIYAGAGDVAADSAPIDGAYFYYLHSVSNGVWCAKTSNNSVTTLASGATSTPPTVTADKWYSLWLEGTSSVVNFWVSSDDGATWQFIGFCTSNIPITAARSTGLETYIRKVAGSTGTTSRALYLGRAEYWPNRGN